MPMQGNGSGVTAKSKKRRCCNRNVAANDKNRVCDNNPVWSTVYSRLPSYRTGDLDHCSGRLLFTLMLHFLLPSGRGHP